MKRLSLIIGGVLAIALLGYTGNAFARYLQPDPMMSKPAYVAAVAASGSTVGPYCYAQNNPMKYTDPTGLAIEIDPSCGNFLELERVMHMLNTSVVTNRNTDKKLTQAFRKLIERSDYTHKIKCDPGRHPKGYCAFTDATGTVLYMETIRTDPRCGADCAGKLIAHELGHIVQGPTSFEYVPNQCQAAARCDGWFGE